MRFNMLLAIAVLLLQGTQQVQGWDFNVFSDSSCVTHTGNANDTVNSACAATPGQHRSFIVTELGNCVLTLYNSLADCNNGNSAQFYDSSNEGTCIPPDFLWDGFNVLGC